jgi:hypothetical protein
MTDEEWEDYYLPKCPDAVRGKYRQLSNHVKYLRQLLRIIGNIAGSPTIGYSLKVENSKMRAKLDAIADKVQRCVIGKEAK